MTLMRNKLFEHDGNMYEIRYTFDGDMHSFEVFLDGCSVEQLPYRICDATNLGLSKSGRNGTDILLDIVESDVRNGVRELRAKNPFQQARTQRAP